MYSIEYTNYTGFEYKRKVHIFCPNFDQIHVFFLQVQGVVSNYQQFNIHFETANWVFVDTLVICFSCRNTCTRISIDVSNLWRLRIWFRHFCDILMNMCCFLFSKQIMGNRPNYMRFIYSEDCCSNCVRNSVSSISLFLELLKTTLLAIVVLFFLIFPLFRRCRVVGQWSDLILLQLPPPPKSFSIRWCGLDYRISKYILCTLLFKYLIITHHIDMSNDIIVSSHDHNSQVTTNDLRPRLGAVKVIYSHAFSSPYLM